MQYPFNLHSLTVCLTINFFFRVKPVREGERRSRRKLGLAPEFKAEDLPVRTRRPRVLVQAPEGSGTSSRACTCTSGTDTRVCTSGTDTRVCTSGTDTRVCTSGGYPP